MVMFKEDIYECLSLMVEIAVDVFLQGVDFQVTAKICGER